MAFVENFPNSSNKINNFFYSLRSLNCFHRCWKFLEKSNQTNKNFQVKIVFSIWRINQSIDQIRSMFDCSEQYLFSAIIKSSISIMMQMFRWMISTKFLFLLISFDIWLTGLRKKRAWTIMLIKQTNQKYTAQILWLYGFVENLFFREKSIWTTTCRVNKSSHKTQIDRLILPINFLLEVGRTNQWITQKDEQKKEKEIQTQVWLIQPGCCRNRSFLCIVLLFWALFFQTQCAQRCSSKQRKNPNDLCVCDGVVWISEEQKPFSNM